MLTFEPISIKKKDTKLVLDWDGKGYSGPYQDDADDKEGDSPLLRMTFFKKDYLKWFPIPYSQLQTYLIATDPRDKLEDAATLLMDAFAKSKQEDWTPLYFKQLAYCHIFNGKASIKIPLDSKDD
jgi:hypothetical protein